MKIVKIIVASLLLVGPAVARADVLDNIPVFWAVTGRNPAYQQAAGKAQEAFLVQSSVSPTFDRWSDHTTRNMEKSASSFIDDDTPFSSRTVFFVAGTAYTLGIKKSVAASFADPIWPSIKNTITVTQNSAMLGFKITF